MPEPKLPLPEDRRVAAFNRLVSIFRMDGVLSRIVRENWITPGHANFEGALPGGVTCVRLTPMPGAEEPMAAVGYGRVAYNCPLTVNVEARASTASWEDSQNLWGRIESLALGRHLQDADLPAFRAENQRFGIDDLDPVEPAVTPADQATAVGSLLITCYIER